MRFVHAMIRVYDLGKALDFWCERIGLKEVRRKDYDSGRFTLVFLEERESKFILELTYNWDQDSEYDSGENFGHFAFLVNDIYQTCSDLEKKGVEILRPPRDGHMAFIKAPDNISVEILQSGEPLKPQEPWISMENRGSW